MQLKILQLNMWADTHFSTIEQFLKENDFDILCFQEVCGPQTVVGNIRSQLDCFERLQNILRSTHNAELTKACLLTSSPTAYDGNAIFYKKEFTLKNKQVLWFTQRSTPFPSDAESFEELGRNALHLQLEKDGQNINIMTAHLPWANIKEEQPHQREKNLKLIEYMQHMPAPWILTGDFNIRSDQPTILDLEKQGKNLGKTYGIGNTIDPLNHNKWEQFKPGTVIDYIFVSPKVQTIDFKVLENVHMSDHFGLTATVSF